MNAYAVIAGNRMATALLFPVVFLYFALPVWGSLINILVDLTVWAVQEMLSMTTIAACFAVERVATCHADSCGDGGAGVADGEKVVRRFIGVGEGTHPVTGAQL